MRAQIDARKGDQRCQPEEAVRTAGIFSCQQQRGSKCRGAVAPLKGIAARFAAHNDCLNQEDKGPAAAGGSKSVVFCGRSTHRISMCFDESLPFPGDVENPSMKLGAGKNWPRTLAD